MQQLAGPLTYQDWDLDKAREAVLEYAGRTGGVMIALHRIQEIFGYIDDSAMPMLGKVFNLSRAEVHGIASFYHDFKREKPGRYTVKVCQAEACQAMGSEKLTEEIKAFLGADFHETSADGNFTLEPVYCLGNCACSPNIMIDTQTYGRVSIDGFKSLASTLAKAVNEQEAK
jgi:formate dehydrogenase subunit gamma